MPATSLAEADAPLVLALDLGTSSLRALLFDRQGRAIDGSEEQLSHSVRTTPDGGVEADATPLFDLLVRCIDGALGRAGERAGEIAAVGVACFWHSLLGLDAQGEPATPILMWADARSAAEAVALRREVGSEATAIQQRTGCRFHSSYWPAKLRWLRTTNPDGFARVARWGSFTDYVALRLFGEARTSFSMASGTGLLDVRRLVWDEELAARLAVAPTALVPLVDRDEPEPSLRSEFAARWSALARVPWYPAIGDGAGANVGCGAIGPDRIALTVGTSGALRVVTPGQTAAPPDLWVYRLDRERPIVGGAVSNGGNVLAWLGKLLQVDFDGPGLEAAAALPPDAHGLTILPFIAGERAPGWHDRAAGAIVGLTLATKPEHLLRAATEAVAYRLALIYDDVRPLAAKTHRVVANGGAILRSPAWLQILADVLGHDLTALPPDDEATARGAALCALHATGLIPTLDAVPDPATDDSTYRPDPVRHATYRAGLERQLELERTLHGSDDH